MNENRQQEATKEKPTLNYSPDTSILLCLDADGSSRAPKPSTPMPTNDHNPNCSLGVLEEHNISRNAPSNGPKFEDSWNNSLPFALEQGHMNIMPISEQIIPHTMFLNSNFNTVHMGRMDSSTPVESYNHVQNMTFIPNYIPQLGVHQPSIEECMNSQNVGGFPIMQVSYPTTNFGPGTQFPPHYPGPEVCTNIYVNKGSQKLSEAEDWTPNPHKLIEILSELEKLNEIICRLKDECDLPDAGPNLKRERNRLASKACRLKKKATHETNKIKLEGLEIEFKLLIYALHFMSWEVVTFVSYSPNPPENLSAKLKDVQNKYLSGIKVAADSDSFVKSVLERTKSHDYRNSFVLPDSVVQV